VINAVIVNWYDDIDIKYGDGSPVWLIFSEFLFVFRLTILVPGGFIIAMFLMLNDTIFFRQRLALTR